MTLNLLQVAPQVHEMAYEVGARRRALARQRDVALGLMREWGGAERLDALRELVRAEQPWLVAEPLEPLCAAHPSPDLPPDATIVATDGSSIDLDRHGLAQCYLINVGAAVIRYGAAPDAALSAQAALYYRDEDLYLDGGTETRVAIQGALLDLKRTLAEQERALELARALRGRGPVVVVMDGTLLLWRLGGRAAEEAYVAEAIAAYGAGLDEFRRLGVPVCSYISRPNGHEVTNLLRLAAEAGDALAPLPDRDLMQHLRPGERSARFASRSPVLKYYGPDARVAFVYLHVGDEVARVEAPGWVGDDPATLDLVHAVVYDGCRRGWGYPPALAEAHEQAIIRGADRDAFMGMVMEALNSADHPAELSAKRLSKNRRAV